MNISDQDKLVRFGKGIGVKNPSKRLEEMAGIARDYINGFDRWESFPELRTALEKSIARAMSVAGSGVRYNVKRTKKRKTDRYL
ncbi:hypothetical protein [Endozoicomonas sp. ALB060]